MFQTSERSSHGLLVAGLLSGVLLGASVIATGARAGDCPADQTKPTAREAVDVISGEIEEYASNCAVPIVHKAGDVTAETKDISHWWKNTGDEDVVLISADLPKM